MTGPWSANASQSSSSRSPSAAQPEGGNRSIESQPRLPMLGGVVRNAAVPATLVAGTVGVAVGGGILAGFGTLVLVILAVPVGIAVSLLTLRNLGFGAALIPFIGAAVPLAVGTGTQSKLVAALL